MENRYIVTESDFKRHFDELLKLVISKNQDYGGASFDLGILGNMVHLWDKVKRYRTLVEKKITANEQPNFEKIQDTLKDIVGYAIIGLIILEKESGNEDTI